MRSHKQLKVYQLAFRTAMEIFEATRSFPKIEAYALTDQLRRSSRSVCSNIAEAFRQRRYENQFILKLTYSECEAAETLTWLDFAYQCKYISKQKHETLIDEYDHIIGMLVTMIKQAPQWVIEEKSDQKQSRRHS